jgi:UDP-N-acetylmuramoyl-tripeptide--D-alanyl-D-alanine ligase
MVVLNADDPLVLQMAQNTKVPVLTYGIESVAADWRAEAVIMKFESSRFEAIGPGERFPVELTMPGRHNILNALAAIAVARFLQVPITEIQEGLAHPELTGKRLCFLEAGGIRIIDDTYNASPASVRAALDVMAADQTARRRIAVLGDMLELGPAAPVLHREIGQYAARHGVDYLFTFGELAREFGNGFTAGHCEAFQEKTALISRLQTFVAAGDLILVKGSRGMKMEEIVSSLAGKEVAE